MLSVPFPDIRPIGTTSKTELLKIDIEAEGIYWDYY